MDMPDLPAVWRPDPQALLLANELDHIGIRSMQLQKNPAQKGVI
jgi:hypothetical protein